MNLLYRIFLYFKYSENGNYNFIGSNIKSLGNIKKIKGNLFLNDLTSLNDLGKLKFVKGNLELKGTKTEIQLEVINRIIIKKLKVNGEIIFGGNDDTIKKLLREKYLPGTLILSDNIEIHLLAIDNINKGMLKVKELLIFGGKLNGIEKILDKEIIPGNLDLDSLRKSNNLGNIKHINGYLNLIGSNIDLQLNIIKKINSKKLIVDGEISFGGNIDGIIKILDEKVIPGNLSFDGIVNINGFGNIEEINGNLGIFDLEKMPINSLKIVDKNIIYKNLQNIDELDNIEYKKAIKVNDYFEYLFSINDTLNK